MTAIKKSLDHIDQFIEKICSFLASLGLLALIAISSVTVIDAFMRRFLGSYINGISDWVSFCMILAVSACFPATIWGKHSITVKILGSLLSKKKADILDIIGQFILLICLAIISWQLMIYTQDVKEYGDVSDLLYIKKWPFFAIATACWWLTTAIQLYLLIKQIILINDQSDDQTLELKV